MASMPPGRLREQNSVWLSQIIKGDKCVENEPSIQINLSRFSFRVCRLKKMSNPCTKKLLLQSECRCAYEHEHFKYIRDDGTIDNDMFDKIISAVRAGRCPHVKPSTITYESSVTAKHAFAAVGNSDMIMAETTYVPTSCFGITPYHVAAIHRCHSAIQKLSNIYNFCSLQFPVQIVENENGVKFHLVATNALKLCIDRNDMTTLKTILAGVTNAYQYNSPILYAIHQGKTESLDMLLASYCEYMNTFHSFIKHEDNFQCTLFAVLSDQPESLAIVMEHLDIQNAMYLDTEFTQMDLARSLGNKKCFEILENWQKSHSATLHLEEDNSTKMEDNLEMENNLKMEDNQPTVSPICTILFKLKFHNLRQFRTTELCKLLEKLVHRGNSINHVSAFDTSPLHYVCGPGPFFDILVHFTLLRLGADINAKDSSGETPLFYVLNNLEVRQFYKKECLKGFIQMALYHNPLLCNIKHWQFFSDPIKFKGLENIYEGLCDDFKECGFVPNGNTELRPLQKMCRDTIRQAFPGCAVHKFVQMMKLPPSIQDFILMKSRLDWASHLQCHNIPET